MTLLKQSTAFNLTFFMSSSGDNVTGVTGLSPTVTISKNGGAFASGGGSVTEIGNGWYYYAATTTDTNTLGDFLLHATGTGANPADEKAQVLLGTGGGGSSVAITIS